MTGVLTGGTGGMDPGAFGAPGTGPFVGTFGSPAAIVGGEFGDFGAGAPASNQGFNTAPIGSFDTGQPGVLGPSDPGLPGILSPADQAAMVATYGGPPSWGGLQGFMAGEAIAAPGQGKGGSADTGAPTGPGFDTVSAPPATATFTGNTGPTGEVAAGPSFGPAPTGQVTQNTGLGIGEPGGPPSIFGPGGAQQNIADFGNTFGPGTGPGVTSGPGGGSDTQGGGSTGTGGVSLDDAVFGGFGAGGSVSGGLTDNWQNFANPSLNNINPGLLHGRPGGFIDVADALSPDNNLVKDALAIGGV
jgi:hypothetical protein